MSHKNRVFTLMACNACNTYEILFKPNKQHKKETNFYSFYDTDRIHMFRNTNIVLIVDVNAKILR